MATVNTRVWINRGSAFVFPEQQSMPPPARTAVCLSGGGTRALSAAWGQLRALHALGLLGRVGYLSCVSGGSWAAVPFTYYRRRPER